MKYTPMANGWWRMSRHLLSLCVVLSMILTTSAEEAKNAKTASGFQFKAVDDKSLGLWEGGQPVFVYNHGIMLKPGVPADRARSSYVHPLYGLDGEVLSDDFPKDHYHHRGLFWSWPHVQYNGKEYDLWMLKGIETRFERWTRQKASSKQAVLGIENGWYVGGEKILREKVTLTAHQTTPEGRALDVELTFTPIKGAVTLAGAEGKSYGGITLRFATNTQTVITTPKGAQGDDLYITRLPWADLSGQFSGKAAGAAIFISPEHPDYPPTWLTRHYGVLCVGWPGVEPRTFEPGKSFTCKYRVWIHRGMATQDELQNAYRAFEKGSKRR